MHLLQLCAVLIGIVEAEVELVQVLFRHGDRAPSFNYPTDVHTEASFARGYSQLTEQGFAQAQELGEYLRYRYFTQQNLVEKYNRQQVYVRSSDKDRCIETAMGVVSTLFPAETVPVPVHTYSTHKDDLLLKPNSVRCPLADEIVAKDKKVMREELNTEYSQLFEHLTKHTGMTVSMSNIADIYNAVFREYANGLEQPEWVWQSLNSKQNSTVFDDILELKRRERLETFNSKQKSKLRTGYLFGQLAEAIEDRVKGLSKRKIALYSTHDATITSLLYSLEASNDLLPPYASAIFVELHNIRGNYFTKFFYRNSTTSDPHPLSIEACGGTMCSLSHFRRFVRLNSFASREEFNSACAVPTSGSDNSSLLSIISNISHIQIVSEISKLFAPLLYVQLALAVFYFTDRVRKEYSY